jgi:hypothetical protein
MARPALGLQIEVTYDLGVFADRTGAKIRRGAMRGAKRFEARAKLEYRQDVRRAGLGDRLANTWRTRVYPLRGESWHPTVHVWSNAPMLAAAHADGGTIVPKAGKFLAIPTENVGHKGGRRRTPLDIESEFNQDLVIKPTRNPNVFLALIRAVRARSGRGIRRASARRQDQGRAEQLVPMFILVRQVTLKPRLNWRGLEGSLGPVFAEYLADEINRELAL